jgi:hypothetical protein
VNVNTYFQDEYYSFSQSTLNAGTTLLSSNNTWTGTNKFALGITSPALDTETAVALNIGVTNASAINIGKVGVNTTIAATLTALTSRVNSLQTASFGTACDLFTSNTGGIASFFTNAARTATLNIQNASTSANIINIGSATSATNVLGLRAATLDSITSSVLSVGSNVLTTGINLNNKVLSGLTYGVNQFVTLSTNTAAPSATQLGYNLVISTGGTHTMSATPNIVTNLQTFTLIPAGVWLFEISFNVNTQNVTQSQFSISTTSATNDANRIMNIQTLLNSAFARVTGIVSLTATSSVYLTGSSTIASVLINAINATRTRIA